MKSKHKKRAYFENTFAMNYGVARLGLEFRDPPRTVMHHESLAEFPLSQSGYVQDTCHKQRQYMENDTLPV